MGERGWDDGGSGFTKHERKSVDEKPAPPPLNSRGPTCLAWVHVGSHASHRLSSNKWDPQPPPSFYIQPCVSFCPSTPRHSPPHNHLNSPPIAPPSASLRSLLTRVHIPTNHIHPRVCPEKMKKGAYVKERGVLWAMQRRRWRLSVSIIIYSIARFQCKSVPPKIINPLLIAFKFYTEASLS